MPGYCLLTAFPTHAQSIPATVPQSQKYIHLLLPALPESCVLRAVSNQNSSDLINTSHKSVPQ